MRDDAAGRGIGTVGRTFSGRLVLLERLAERAADKATPGRLLRRTERSANLSPGAALLASREHQLS